MSSTLRSPAVVDVLDRLRAVARENDERAKRRVKAREAELGTNIYGQERADLYGEASLAITTEVGELIYVLALNQGGRRIVEFGASLGFSTIFLAAAIRDGGAGSLITTEFQANKAERARQNLIDAGLEDVVELRVGDALQSLRDLPGPIDMLFLDGWNDLYMPLLELLEPQLSRGSLVVADMSTDDPNLLLYQEYVRDPRNGYISVDIPLDAGVEVSLRIP